MNDPQDWLSQMDTAARAKRRRSGMFFNGMRNTIDLADPLPSPGFPSRIPFSKTTTPSGIEQGLTTPSLDKLISGAAAAALGMEPELSLRFQAIPSTGGGRPASKAAVRLGRQPPPEVISAAQNAQRKWGVPASITLAQWALESGWGRRMPPNSNNPFGIKAKGNEPSVKAATFEYVNGKRQSVDADFRAFSSLDDAMEGHAALLATGRPYAKARTVMHDPNKFADALTGVYATAPKYGAMLRGIMRKSNLYDYDIADQPVAR